jgi:hypothetical protein
LVVEGDQLVQTVWGVLPVSKRRFVVAALIVGFSQLILVDLYFRIQELPQINQCLAGGPLSFIEDGIQYPPFVLSGLACGVLVATSVILVNSSVRRNGTLGPSWLGSAWLLASCALIIDLMMDTFEVKWPVIILFAYVGLRYWMGSKRNVLAVVLALVMTVIAALDGLHHAGGQDCLQTGLASCTGKAVSDIYLTIALLILTYLTIYGLGQRTVIHSGER